MNDPVVPVASDSTGTSWVTMPVFQGSPLANRAWSVELTPYERSPTRRVSAWVVRVSSVPETV
ncbi:hypothetical protein AB0J81_28490 [Streptomyces bobili]|uniref:hypothetical protein n=1 Tax=Streptomyces bobili TaxID=67280 RepID=UPI0034200F80